MTPKSMVAWGAVAVVGAVCWTVLALSRGENVSALWILFAALSSYAIAYRFYARFIAYRVLGVDDTRATPAERLQNGATSMSPTGGCCSGTISRRSPALAPWSGQSWPR